MSEGLSTTKVATCGITKQSLRYRPTKFTVSSDQLYSKVQQSLRYSPTKVCGILWQSLRYHLTKFAVLTDNTVNRYRPVWIQHPVFTWLLYCWLLYCWLLPYGCCWCELVYCCALCLRGCSWLYFLILYGLIITGSDPAFGKIRIHASVPRLKGNFSNYKVLIF